jgi:malate dehydrogenase (oxaloacetate-decarboxylating)
MDEWQVFPEIAARTGIEAQREGLARIERTEEELYREAERVIRRSRDLTASMMEHGFIAPPPAGPSSEQEE